MNKDYRSYQLTFCSVCKLRAFNSNKGIICSLTNDISQFEKECPDYDFDSIELERIKKSIKEKIKKNYNTNKTLTSVLSISHFNIKDNIKIKNYYKNKEATHNKFFEDINQNYMIITVTLTLSFIFIFIFFNQKFNSTFFYLFIATLIIGTILYIVEDKREKKHIKTTENYLKFGEKIIYWREILEYGIHRIPHKSSSTWILVMFTINNSIIEIKLNNYSHIISDEMIEILNYNKSDLAD